MSRLENLKFVHSLLEISTLDVTLSIIDKEQKNEVLLLMNTIIDDVKDEINYLLEFKDQVEFNFNIAEEDEFDHLI